MKTKSIQLIVVFSLLLASCGNKTTSDNCVKSDSTVTNENLQQEEINQMSSFINEVSKCIDSIQIQENMIFENKEGSVNKQKLLEQMRGFKELLARKQTEITALANENKAISSSSKATITNLKKLIEYLNNQLSEKVKEVESLEQLIQKKDTKIDELRYNVGLLSQESDYLKEQNYQQDRELNAVYYIVGSKKEFKKIGILKTGFLSKKIDNTNIDMALFKKVDKRNFTQLVIDDKSPKILTNNPTNSFILTKNDDGTSTLTITDPDKFWKVSQYLIIQK